MKKIMLVVCFAILAGFANKAMARGVIFYSTGEKISVVEALPDSIITDDGEHLNIGVMYKQFSVMWLPVWNYSEPRYVLTSDDKKTYWEFEDDDLESIKEEFSLKIPDTPKPPFWQRVGIKPLIILLILYYIWDTIKGRKKKEEEELMAEENSADDAVEEQVEEEVQDDANEEELSENNQPQQ